MSANQCLNSSSSQLSKYMIDAGGDKTRCTQNLSKLCQNCKIIKDQLQAQIFTLKDKSHQSFMQVIQVQQLHEQQMQLMKVQHQQQINSLKQQIEKYRQQIKELQIQLSKYKNDMIVMQKNSKHHICYVQSPSFLIQNIQMIQCNEQFDKKSKLDQSSFDQFNQFVQTPIQRFHQNLNQNFLKPKSNQNIYSNKQLSNTQTQQKIQKLNLRIIQLETQIQSLWQTNQQLKKQCQKIQANQKSIKNNYDSLYKESKFMADHIRTLANDKFKLQRKVKQLQKQLKQIKTKSMKQSGIHGESMKQSGVFGQSNRQAGLNDYQKPSMMSIKINGSELFNSQDIQLMNVRNSLQNSRQETDVFSKPILPQSLASNNHNQKNSHTNSSNTINANTNNKKILHNAKSTQNFMTKSQMLSNSNSPNNNEQIRKSIPNYKKVSHISPSFRKTSSHKLQQQKQKQSPVIKIQNRNFIQDDKSDFMDQIRKQVQLKINNLKKSGNLFSQYEGPKTSLFHDNNKKRW